MLQVLDSTPPQRGRGDGVGRKLILAMLSLAALWLPGCALDGPQSTLAPSGPVAASQLSVFHVTLIISVVIFLVVGGLMIYAVFRFPAPPQGDAAPLPPQTHGNAFLEVTLTLISILLVGVMAFPTVQGIFYMSTVPMGAEPLEINVTGYQWWWSFEYPKQAGIEKAVVTGNEMAIPTGRPVKVNLRTNDVIHSFWVPKLAGKMDLMPNQDNWLWLQADEPSNYFGQCAEFCGESHAFMKFRVVALAPEDFDRWVDHQASNAATPSGDLAERGMKLFQQKKCWTCHMVRGTRASFGKAGPDLTHFASRSMLGAAILDNTDENVRVWLADNYRIKPGNLMFTEGGIALKGEAAEAERALRNEQVAHWNSVTMTAEQLGKSLSSHPGLEGLKGRAVVPAPELTSEDIDALVAYLRSLK